MGKVMEKMTLPVVLEKIKELEMLEKKKAVT